MQYTRKVLNRSTGELEEIDLGNWITIRELGEMHGLGRRHTTEVLRHLGVLQIETTGRVTRHLLAAWFVERGLGKRHYRRVDKFPFDVVSPDGQEWLADVWALAVQELEQARQAGPVAEAKADFEGFKTGRREMLIQLQVYWLADFWPTLTQAEMATVLSVSQQLVSRNLSLRADQRSGWREFRSRPLADKPSPDWSSQPL
ncbi:hypothetical protein [Rhizobium sp. LjRoot254]|uniref:hypothetical protein n=1 Tax=Rhizobium sp. LjRoot254 TaxID=3342297 RepID=UPI003ED01C06